MPRLAEHDIDLGKEIKILYTYSRRKQARALDRAVATHECERNSGAESQTVPGKRKHLKKKDSQNERLQESNGSGDSRRLPASTLKRPKRKRRLAVEQLVLLPSLSLNRASLEAKLRATRIRDGSNEPLDGILTSNPTSPNSHADAGPNSLSQPSASSGKPLSIIRSQLLLPKCDQQQPPDLSRFLLPPTTPQISRLPLREIGSGFEGLGVQPQRRRRPAVHNWKEKRRVTNKRLAPLGLAIAKPLSPESAENPQRAPSSLDPPFRTSGGDSIETSNDPGANIVDEGIDRQDSLRSSDKHAHFNKPQSHYGVEGKSNRSGDIEALNQNPAVSAPSCVPYDRRDLQGSGEVGITTARDYGAYPGGEASGDRNARGFISSGTRSIVKGRDQDHSTGTERRVSFLRELPNGRLESMQTIKAELVEKVLETILSSDLLQNPWADCHNEKGRNPRTGSLEVSTKTYPSAKESEKLLDPEWRVAFPNTRGRSIELENEVLDCASPTLTEHSYCRRQHDSLPLDNPFPDSTATSEHQDSVMSLLPRKGGRQITLEVPETQKSTNLDQYVRQDQGPSSVSAVSKRVSTFRMYGRSGEKKSEKEDKFADVRSIPDPANLFSHTVLGSRNYFTKTAKSSDSSIEAHYKIVQRKLGPLSTNPEPYEEDVPAKIPRPVRFVPNSSHQRTVLTQTGSQDLRISGRKASMELGSMPSRRQPSLLPFVPPFK